MRHGIGVYGPSFGDPDPEMAEIAAADAELDARSRELAAQVQRTPEDKRPELREKLVNTVREQFELRQRRRVLELERLEAELKRLREAIDRRAEARDAIINKRVNQLVGESDELEF